MLQIRYFPGNTFLHRLDPRSKFLLLIFFIFVEVAFRDVRIVAIPFLASVIMYFSAKIPYREVRGTWKFLLVVIVVISSINVLFTLVGTTVVAPHVVFRYWIFTITQEGLSLAVAATMRLLSLAIVSITLVMTTDPGLYGPAMSKLGVPYRGGYVFDLAIRYVPTYANDLEATMNAQMARGYRPRGSRKGILSSIVNTVPLIVPVSVNAMLSIYDIADAMELRAFGVKKQRTWYRDVRFGRMDYATVAVVLAALALSIYLRTLFTGYWIPG
ncbi:MAG: energy-coupling factor transporter transmembrane protein EcfT [Thaumarchaeota archaeon]|nr:energy-coupling factor transporter transmembrane protein EcfT [Nitrososphaerota archaeon]